MTPRHFSNWPTTCKVAAVVVVILEGQSIQEARRSGSQSPGTEARLLTQARVPLHLAVFTSVPGGSPPLARILSARYHWSYYEHGQGGGGQQVSTKMRITGRATTRKAGPALPGREAGKGNHTTGTPKSVRKNVGASSTRLVDGYLTGDLGGAPSLALHKESASQRARCCPASQTMPLHHVPHRVSYRGA